MKKLLISACALGMGLNLSFGQFGEGPMGPPEGAPPELAAGMASPEIMELRLQVRTLRQQVEAAREALRAELGEDATPEERTAALEQWHIDNAALLAELRVATEELTKAVRDARPGVGPIVVPDEIAEKQVLLKESREALAADREALIDSLGEDATEEEIRAALATWHEENAEAIAATRALAQEIRDWFRAQRPNRPGRGVSEEMKNRRAEFQANAAAVRENRREFGAAMGNRDLTTEERRAQVEEFRAAQRELMRERAELKRQERLNQVGEGGDRRPGG